MLQAIAATTAWYWLDAIYSGAKAVGKEVWMPYIYQEEDKWDNDRKRATALESDTRTGLMAKGLVTLDRVTYYFDEVSGVLVQ